MDSIRHFSIWQACLYSALAHGLVFSAFSLALPEGANGDWSGVTRLEARLPRQSIAGNMAVPEIQKEIRQEKKSAPKVEGTKANSPKPVVSEALPKVVRTQAGIPKPVVSGKIQTPESDTFFSDHNMEESGVAQEEMDVGQRSFAAREPTDSAGQGNPDYDAYKAALERAMKDMRGYPKAARLRGITGKASIRLAWRPDFSTPQVELSVSSGSNILDEDALARLTRAARITPLPKSLRARSFDLSQTVEYSLE